MKRILYTLVALAAVVGFTSCETKNNKGQLDPNAMISLRPAEGVPSGKAEAVNPKHLTAKEIVEQASIMSYWNVTLQPDHDIWRSFSDKMRDFDNNCLLMEGTDIISMYGTYVKEFIESKDVILITREKAPDASFRRVDTIAYVPNKVLGDAQKIIKAAFDRGDYTTVYSAFDKAFTFLPITGTEWLELKAKGLN